MLATLAPLHHPTGGSPPRSGEDLGWDAFHQDKAVIASEARQSSGDGGTGLLRRFASRNDDVKRIGLVNLYYYRTILTLVTFESRVLYI